MSLNENLDYIDENETEPDVFDPELFKENSELIINKIGDYLSDKSIRGVSMKDPSQLVSAARDLMTDSHDKVPSLNVKMLEEIVDLYIKTGIQVHSPGFMGRQFSGIIPLAGALDMIGSIVNQPSSFYEAGQLPNAVEKIMADELNKFIGYEKDTFEMVTTSGGSLANLTAILAARNDKFPDFWDNGAAGLNGSGIPAIAVSEDVHYSIKRAVGIVGIGANQIILLPVNKEKKIDIDAVPDILDDAEKRGLRVFCMVGTAGSTSVGAFDPIDKLADIAHERDIWLHIDGAHGASLLVSDDYRHKLKGIEKADSFAWDAHKLLFVPAICTMLFYKDKEKSYGAFHQEASYVFEKEPDMYTKFDSAEKNFECTKRPLIMNLWILWALYGKSLFSSKIEHLCKTTQNFHDLLEGQKDFIPLHQPEANILCFQYLPKDLNGYDIATFQGAIREQMRLRGKFFISKVDIDGTTCLRVVFMNHLINLDHCNKLLKEIREIGREILKQGKEA